MFQPPKGQTQGARLIHFQSKISEICAGRKIQFIEQSDAKYVPDVKFSLLRAAQ
jgi:GTP:adenosylcobinamide-phosphate guanylyltransferase